MKFFLTVACMTTILEPKVCKDIPMPHTKNEILVVKAESYGRNSKFKPDRIINYV